jgi:hypothetical protein
MHQQGLLDRQEFLQSILEMVEKCKNPEDPLFRLLMPTLLRKHVPQSSTIFVVVLFMLIQVRIHKPCHFVFDPINDEKDFSLNYVPVPEPFFLAR